MTGRNATRPKSGAESLRRGDETSAAAFVAGPDRDSIERSLREANERLNRMIETAHDAVVSIGAEGAVIAWNSRAESMFGWAAEEAIGRNLADMIIPEEFRSAHNAGLRRVIEGGASRIFNRRLELHALHRNGDRIPVELSIWPVESASGYSFSAFIRDLSERKRTEAAAEARATQIRLHRNVLLELARLDQPDFPGALRQILRVTAQTLDVERVSYWAFSGDLSEIRREMLVLNRSGKIVSGDPGIALHARDFPDYFAALGRSNPIVANDACTHPETREFAAEYLPSLGIASMLDVSVWFRGVMVGVICHEHVGPPRAWSAEEVDFASAIATMVAMAMQASARQELVEALSRSEQKYRHVVDYAGEAIIVAQQGRIRFANPKCAEISGYSLEDLEAVPFLKLVHPDDQRRVGENYQKRLAGVPAEDHYSFRVVRRGGEIIWLQISAVRIDWEGEPATLNFLSDMTERNRLQDRLGETLMEREAILETAVVGIVFIQFGIIKWINPILEERMLGYGKGELIGRRGESTFKDHADWSRFLGASIPFLERGEGFETELEMRRKDGSLFWSIFSGRAIDATDLNKGSIWSMVDISERKTAEDEVRGALEKERELNELKSRFVAMTSHEFRTPLAAILSSVELLEDYSDRLAESERNELTGNVKTAVKRMTEMLDQVLLIGKVDAGRLEFNPSAVKIEEFCRSVLTEIRPGISANHELSLSVRLATRHALLDPVLLRRILSNLLVNAVKYSPQGGQVNLNVEGTKNDIRFAVSDEGIGIPEADRSRLFEAFHRARNIGNISGTGLGLAIVKRCVDLHGGEIGFESKDGKGTRFVVRIPISNE
jgi:PAS domain S-box-containing protein